MSAIIIDGKAIGKKLRAEYHARVDQLRARHGVTPGLAVVLVGNNPASRSYVKGKIIGCKEVGIRSELIELPDTTTEAELLARIDALNADPATHGILVQLPLPLQIRVASVVERISVEKDVDGFHLYNMGGLVTGSTVFSPEMRSTTLATLICSTKAFRSRAATWSSSARATWSASQRP